MVSSNTQVNAAVDDVAALAEANAKLVAAAKGRGTGLSVEDRRHAQSLVRNVVVSRSGSSKLLHKAQNAVSQCRKLGLPLLTTDCWRLLQAHEGVKGSYWILERDCKNGSVVKMDKTGKVGWARVEMVVHASMHRRQFVQLLRGGFARQSADANVVLCAGHPHHSAAPWAPQRGTCDDDCSLMLHHVRLILGRSTGSGYGEQIV